MSNVNIRDFIDEKYDLFINGEFQASDSGETLDVTNPANGETLAQVAKANQADVDKAVKAAQDAFDSWSKISKEERADYLLEISRRILEKKNILRLLSRYKTVNRTVKRLRLIFLKQQISINILQVC